VRVALFATCLSDTLFPAAGRATVAVIERLGHEVVFPLEQTCCGQMHLNSGYEREAEPLLRRFSEVFAEEETIVSPSGSCVALVRERCGEVGGRVLELSEFLVDLLGVEDVGARYPHRVAYHPACHGLRGLGLGDRPLRLLRAVRDLELVNLADAEQCCGFGGTFSIKNADTSIAMLEDKVRSIAASGAEVCAAGDSSCLMHIGGGLARRHPELRVRHLAEILAAR